MERFACRTEVISGEGALEELKQMEGKRLAVVTEPMLAESMLVRRLTERMRWEQILLLKDVGQKPTIHQAVEGAGRLRDFRPELVTALGGGNVMDLAKAMVCFSKIRCTLTLVPTGIGVGVEVAGQVTLYHERRSHVLQDAAMRPDRTILDRAAMENTPRSELAEDGFALLADSLESYTARHRGVLSDLHGREAFAACWGALPACLAGDHSARMRIQTASVLAGLAWEQTGLGLCRAMCSSLGSLFPLSRGKLAAILLPTVVGHNGYVSGRRYWELSRAAGMGGSSEGMGIRNLRTGLLRLRRELELPGTLAQGGIPPAAVWRNVKTIVALTLEDPECRCNPVTVDDYMIRRILEEITG